MRSSTAIFVVLFFGSEPMSMQARKPNRRTNLAGLPAISKIAACAGGGRQDEAGDPSRIRTCNPRSRNPLLYPVELWDHNFRTLGLLSIANMKNPLRRQAGSEPFSAIPRLSLRANPRRVDRCFRSAPDARLRPAGFRPRRALGSTDRGSLRPMLHATFSPSHCPAMSPSPFNAHLPRHAARVRARSSP